MSTGFVGFCGKIGVMTKHSTIDVLVPHGYKPSRVELEAAWILARHYKKVVLIINKKKVLSKPKKIVDTRALNIELVLS
jgi:hypothetical protein